MRMERIKRFFAWWYSELRGILVPDGQPPLVLELTDPEIVLRARDGAMIGAASLSSEDSALRLEALRSSAEQRSRGQVELQLPRDQVAFRSLPAEGTLEEAAALSSGYPAGSLLVAAGAPPRTRSGQGQRPAAIALKTSVEDALSAARGWGFHPVQVTSLAIPAEFGPAPVFFSRLSRQRPAPLTLICLGLAVLALLLIALAGTRALSVREAMAARDSSRAANIGTFEIDLLDSQRKLVEYADSSALAVEARLEAPLLWAVLAELKARLPDDIALSRISWKDKVLEIEGRGAETVGLAASLETSPLFSGVSLRASDARGEIGTEFTLEAPVTQRAAP